jgi:protein Tex
MSEQVTSADSKAINPQHVGKITAELKLGRGQVEVTARLLAEGGTVPFIARYRKEATGTLDEVAIAAIRDRLQQLAELDRRRDAIVGSLAERKLLTAELKGQIDAAETLAVLEDIYLPFRPKKRTRATMAREAGLAPLAEKILAEQETVDPDAVAAEFVNQEKGIETVAAALQGARDILAEKINEDATARAQVRALFLEKGLITSKVMMGKEQEGAKFKDYFEWSEPVKSAPSHRVLAIRRGAAEEVLLFRIAPPEGEAVAILERLFVKEGKGGEQVRLAVADCCKRLMSPSLEIETRLASKKKADEEAIRVFAVNLRELLMASPLGQKVMLAIDPGFRTGCKVVVLDRQGKLLHNDVIYPDQGAHKTAEAELTIRKLVEKHGIEAIAIGNGTGSREVEGFIRKLGLPAAIPLVAVNESGASIYSASAVAREEFPDHDITVRGAVSIGRRLMDPLAELVKLDAKSIGVGQYQHDVDQEALKKQLDDVVVSCVNAVGVEVNTASKQLLTYVAGLNETIAENIVKHRNEHGPFKSRKDLREVPRLGPKTFEQAAGFLRVRGAENPLDESAVHPERYALVDQMARDLGADVKAMMRDEALRKKLDLKTYVTGEVGLPTLMDILAELVKPGRDPRQQFEAFAFAEGVSKIEDVQVGMKLPGIVTNVTAFGAFVDIGVHQDGLVHVSQLADRFVKNAAEVVKVGQRVAVTVLEVDIPRKRISLSMRKQQGRGAEKAEAGRTSASQGPGVERPAAVPSQGWLTVALGAAKTKAHKGGL